jgi:hypothetical protein
VQTSLGGLSFYVELFNIFGFRNTTRVDSYTFTGDANGVITAQRHTEAVLGVVLSFGITSAF